MKYSRMNLFCSVLFYLCALYSSLHIKISHPLFCFKYLCSFLFIYFCSHCSGPYFKPNSLMWEVKHEQVSQR